MAINRNLLFLESFSVILIISVFGNVEEFVRTLISDHPHSYFMYLIGYVIVVAVVIFAFYKITYRPPKYEKLVNKSQKRQAMLIDGLKSKIDTIDDKKRLKEEKRQAKLQAKLEKEQQRKQTREEKIPSSSIKSSSSHSTPSKSSASKKHRSASKSKTVRRRK